MCSRCSRVDSIGTTTTSLRPSAFCQRKQGTSRPSARDAHKSDRLVWSRSVFAVSATPVLGFDNVSVVLADIPFELEKLPDLLLHLVVELSKIVDDEVSFTMVLLSTGPGFVGAFLDRRLARSISGLPATSTARGRHTCTCTCMLEGRTKLLTGGSGAALVFALHALKAACSIEMGEDPYRCT